MKTIIIALALIGVSWGLICFAAPPRQAGVKNRNIDSESVRQQQQAFQSMARANTAIERGDYALAEKLLLNVVRKYPSDSLAWSALGHMYEKQGQTHEAVAAFAKVVHPAPGSGSTLQKDSAFLMRYAVLCAKANQWHESRIAVNEAVANSAMSEILTPIPNGVKPQLVQLQALSRLFDGIQATKNGDDEANRKAVDLFNAALDLSPNLAAASYQKGLALENLGRHSDAENAYREAMRHGNDAVKRLSAEKMTPPPPQ